MNKVKVTKEVVVFKKYSTVVEGHISEELEDGKVVSYTREKIVRPDAVAALIYNIDTESVILVNQFRYPIDSEKNDGFIYEVMAGKIDPGETPINTLKRESLEEVGYKLKNKNIIECMPAFAVPGYSTEKIYLYLVTVTNKDKIAKGGGKEGEEENIDIIEMPYLIFANQIDCFNDMKTRVLAYEAHYRKLFDIKPKKIVRKPKPNNNSNYKIKF